MGEGERGVEEVKAVTAHTLSHTLSHALTLCFVAWFALQECAGPSDTAYAALDTLLVCRNTQGCEPSSQPTPRTTKTTISYEQCTNDCM